MKKLIIHIGYPKTATTSLQLNLFAHLHKEGKIEYLNHLNSDTNGYMGIYNIKNILQSVVSKNVISENEIKKELKALKNIEKDISVISAETLSSWHPDFSYSSINSDAKQNAQRFKDFFSPYFDAVEILIGIRTQQALLRGVYKQWYHLIIGEKPKYSKIENWLKANVFDKKDTSELGFNFYSLVNQYTKTFGSNNVYILVYEDLLNDKSDYFNKLSSIFNIESTIIEKSLTKKKQNTSIKTNSGIETENATLGQIITRPFRHRIKKHFNEKTYNNLKSVYQALVPDIISQKVTTKKTVIRELTPMEIELIFNKYYDSNHKLIDIMDLDKTKMKEYKYI